MELIKPKQISGEIMTLIEEADKKVILVSPYFKISKWYKLLKCFEALKKRNIQVEIYVREDENESIEEVREIGFQPITIPNLHAKLYLNEKYAIISSMNLLLSSDTSSLDIGLKTENGQEYNDIWDFYTRYIKKSAPQQPSYQKDYDWREELSNGLFKLLGTRIVIKETANNILINTSNRYEVFIDNGNELKMSGILSGKEFDYSVKNKKILQQTKIDIELVEGGSGYYNTVWGSVRGIKSRNITKLQNNEDRIIVDSIIQFIAGVEQLKKMAQAY